MTGPPVDLPPGQKRREDFPRFGVDLSRPPPPVPDHPVLEITGAVTEAFELPLSDLAALPQQAITADFHCVAGWSATGLRWEGVGFGEFYRTIVEPALRPGAAVTHLVFRGLDRYQAIVAIEDALGDDVLLATRLGGGPLDGDHGAPLRLVSPRQYGYLNPKHVVRIEVLTRAARGPVPPFDRLPGRLLAPHPRARVWEEERHRYVPGPLLRPLYQALVNPIIRSGRPGRGESASGPKTEL